MPETPLDPRLHKLDGVKAEVAAKVRQLLKAMELLGHPMLITDAFRTTEQQQLLYAQGRTTPGPIVTHADGLRRRSKHQDGVAVDLTFWHVGADGVARPCWCAKHPWLLYGEAGKALGLKWGGDWKSPDRPHLEMP
ncbi:MAG TPA: M15 family metallopeptidase [bacterium]|nr:M15 family metallopeptidase [bacterium]